MGMAIIEKTDEKCWQECGGMRTLLHTGGNVRGTTALRNMAVPHKARGPAVSLVGIYAKNENVFA